MPTNLPPFWRSYALAALFLAASCASPQEDTVAPKGTSRTQNALGGLEWTSGTLATGKLVPVEELRDLPGVNDATVAAGQVGGLVGTQFWKSNNPEAVTSEGWMMTNGNYATQRKGTATPLSGPVALYLSHLNFTGQLNSLYQSTTNRALYIHLIASNPGTQAITITGKGKMAANNKWRYVAATPLSVKSAWYLCSEAWINDALDDVSKTIEPSEAVEIAKVLLPAQPSGEPVYATEGRYELNVAGGGAFFSAVATYDGSLDRAVEFATGSTDRQQQAYGKVGDPRTTPIPDTGTDYGREAGITTNSAYFSGNVNLTLPASGTSYMALCFNTNRRKPAILNNLNVFYQEQSAEYTMRLESSSRTWAGYGHKYNAQLVLTNPTATQKNVRLSFGANPVNAAIVNGSNNVLFDGPVQTLVDGGAAQVHQIVLFNNQDFTPDDGKTFVNPRGPQRQPLRTVPVPGNSTVRVNVICYIPGLVFGAGQQLVLESGV